VSCERLLITMSNDITSPASMCSPALAACAHVALLGKRTSPPTNCQVGGDVKRMPISLRWTSEMKPVYDVPGPASGLPFAECV